MSEPQPKIVMIAALARNRVIGRDNMLLWRLKSDLRRFRDLTMGKPIIMGRKTFQSIGRPLPGRHTIVMTRDASFAPDGVTIASSLEEALDTARSIAKQHNQPEIAIVGGAQIYDLAMPLADDLYLTHVEAQPEGDAFFPPVDPAIFAETARADYSARPDDEHAFSFVDYVRRR